MKKIGFVIVVVLMVCSLTGCSELFGTSLCNHDFQKEATVEPTIREDGYTVYRCTKCGYSEYRDMVNSIYKNAKYYESEVVRRFKETLIDPDSVKYDVSCKVSEDFDGKYYYRIHFNAKNRLGGYVGYHDIYIVRYKGGAIEEVRYWSGDTILYGSEW